jgi:hypothetical protein
VFVEVPAIAGAATKAAVTAPISMRRLRIALSI